MGFQICVVSILCGLFCECKEKNAASKASVKFFGIKFLGSIKFFGFNEKMGYQICLGSHFYKLKKTIHPNSFHFVN